MEQTKIITILIIALLTLTLSPAFAKPKPTEPPKPITDIFLNWAASSYVPADYQGRPVASQGSVISVEAIALDNANLNNYTFNWYLDNQFYPSISGQGRQSFSFIATKKSGAKHKVFLQLTNNFTPILSKTIQIPVAQREILMYNEKNGEPIVDSVIAGPGEEILIKSIPYFFNISAPAEMDYRWTLNGKTASSEKGSATANFFKLKIGAGTVTSPTNYLLEFLAGVIKNTDENIRKNIRVNINNGYAND